jgi:tripartite-type tricarboxylate transporter receptor subunit TctC
MSVPINLSRRDSLRLAAATGIWFSAGGIAKADTFPGHPVNFIVPYAAGGDFDSYVREFCGILTSQLNVDVEPINMPGAAGAEAIFNLAQDAPDGYNISIANVPGILHTKPKPGFDPNKMTWLANLGRDTLGLAVSSKSPINSIADLQKLSRERVVKMSSSGKASADYLVSKIIAGVFNLNVNIVDGYEGSVSSMVAVARGDVDVTVHSLASIANMESSHLVRLMFVFAGESPAGIENAMTVNQPDLGKLFQYRPVVAPPGLPPDVAATLSSALVTAAMSPEAKAWAAKIKTTLYPLDQQQTTAMILEQQALLTKWKGFLTA